MFKTAQSTSNIFVLVFAFMFLFIFSINSISAVTEPFTITENTIFGLTENTVIVTITENLGKNQNVDISNLFIDHPLTDALEYSPILINQSYISDVYDFIDISLGKYKTSDTIYWFDNKSVEHSRIVYLDDFGSEMVCDYVLGDKSCMSEVWGVVGTELLYDFRPLPTTKEKIVVAGLKIEQKESGIPLPANSIIQVKYLVKHPIVYGSDYAVRDVPYNKYDIKVCSETMECTILDPEWYGGGWGFRRELVVDFNEVVESLNNFPIHLFINQLNNVSSDGADIRVTDNSNNELPVEIEYYDNISGNLSLFFKGNISDSSNTSFWLYYGNDAVSLPEINSTYGAENVWDNYVAVWHFNIDPSVSDLIDSTSYNQDATMNGGMPANNLVNTQYSKGIDFDGGYDGSGGVDSEYFYVLDNSFLDISGDLTIDAFLTQDTDPESYPAIIRKDENYVLYKLKESLIPSAIAMRTSGISATDTIDMPIGSKHFWNGRYNGSAISVWRDGSQRHSEPKSGALTTNDETLYIGYYPSAGVWDGIMDELRLSNVSRSNGYITTTHNNLINRLCVNRLKLPRHVTLYI